MSRQVRKVLFGSPRSLDDVVEGQTNRGAPPLISVPWTSIDVRSDAPRQVASAAGTASEPNAVIIVTGAGTEEEVLTEETGRAFIR